MTYVLLATVLIIDRENNSKYIISTVFRKSENDDCRYIKTFEDRI